MPDVCAGESSHFQAGAGPRITPYQAGAQAQRAKGLYLGSSRKVRGTMAKFNRDRLGTPGNTAQCSWPLTPMSAGIPSRRPGVQQTARSQHRHPHCPIATMLQVSFLLQDT